MHVIHVTIPEISTIIPHGAGYSCENDKMASLLQNYTKRPTHNSAHYTLYAGTP